ncbi:hypothetical protein B0H17DRAFT_931921, partial [Mycena rosella]
YVLIEGHAILLVIPSHRGEVNNILNIYAPNTPQERERMWAQLWYWYFDNPELPLPTETLGDWNFVENIEDRTSNKEELIPPSFLCLKALFRMQDGWRTTFPDSKEYTCSQKRTNAITNEILITGSRLDRIYVPVDRFKRYRNWSIKPSLITSDHHLISVQLTCGTDEEYGPGIWNLPVYLLKTPKFMKYLSVQSKELAEEREEMNRIARQNQSNIQHLWHKFKEDVTTRRKNCSRLHWLNISSFSVRKLVKNFTNFTGIFIEKVGEKLETFSEVFLS